MHTYNDYCHRIHEIYKDVIGDITEVLNKRGVDYINVHGYTRDYDIDERVEIPTADKNGYGVICTIDHIRKDGDKWVADLVNECGDEWDSPELADVCYFDTSVLIDIYGMILSIFSYADTNNNGHVCGKGEYVEDLENEED